MGSKAKESAREKVGRMFYNRRADLRISLREAARIAGIDKGQAVDIEKGRTNYTVDTFLAYCGALEIKLRFDGIPANEIIAKRLKDEKEKFDNGDDEAN